MKKFKMTMLALSIAAAVPVAAEPHYQQSRSAASEAQQVFEVKDSIYSGPTLATRYEGYTGEGYLQPDKRSGDLITWTVNVPHDGEYDISFSHASNNDRHMQLSINNEAPVTYDFPNTGEFGNWTESQAHRTVLNAGSNTITLESQGSLGPHIDNLKVTALQENENRGVIQAEDSLSFGTSIENSIPGFTGTGYRKGELIRDDVGITFGFQLPVDGKYKLSFRYSSLETRSFIVSEGGSGVSTSYILPSTETEENWSSSPEMTIELTKGRNTVSLITDQELIPNVDHLEVVYIGPSGPGIIDPVPPIDGTDPIDPLDPTDPSVPAKPIDPGNPQEPVEPIINPGEPIDPIDGTDPVDPLDPNDPNDPVKPIDPGNPEDELIPITPPAPLTGKAEFAQTHVYTADDQRIVPKLIPKRNTHLLFTPDTPLDSSQSLVVTGTSAAGEALGTLNLTPPAQLPIYKEQMVSSEELDSYSHQAWSVQLPWYWVTPGVQLSAAIQADSGVLGNETDIALPPFTAETHHTVRRVKILAWDGEWQDHPFDREKTLEGQALLRDFYGSVPVSSMTLSDFSPIYINEYLVNNGEDIILVDNDDDYKATGNKYYDKMLKRITVSALTADYGGGLLPSNMQGGPRANTVNVGMGEAREADGSLHDLADTGVAGGSHGWSAIWWNSDCGNAFIHEVGHAYGLSHFTTGTAERWGIADEYPEDGVNLAGHPSGFDTVSQQFRSWYRVDSSGPIENNSELDGKHDPMNGGDKAWAGSYCYPQFTAYHAQKIQNNMENRAIYAQSDNGPIIVEWDSESHSYQPSEIEYDVNPVQINSPIITIFGQFSANGDLALIQPAMYNAIGNIFEHPSPFEPGLPVEYNGSQFYLIIDFDDDSRQSILIGKKMSTANALYDFGLNLAYNNVQAKPVNISLYKANEAYPNIVHEQSTLLASRDEISDMKPIAEPLSISEGYMGKRNIELTEFCTTEVHCEETALEVETYYPNAALVMADYHTTPGEVSGGLIFDGEAGQTTVTLDNNKDVPVYATASRRINFNNGTSLDLPVNDATVFDDVNSESIRIWAEIEDNLHLSEHAGIFRSDWQDNMMKIYPAVNGVVLDSDANSLSIRSELTLPRKPGSAFYVDAQNNSFYFANELITDENPHRNTLVNTCAQFDGLARDEHFADMFEEFGRLDHFLNLTPETEFWSSELDPERSDRNGAYNINRMTDSKSNLSWEWDYVTGYGAICIEYPEN
ncbi:M66 family metalloprotease [Psychromonas ossibalaenae]|uniref:M66 family metalloprotease n=1 Tax=Psychromonas ossibalaenae TaxID=444922 RepID=UPI000382C330|nr:M66 family metalloprotease [Psychromonas ossibalaenae]